MKAGLLAALVGGAALLAFAGSASARQGKVTPTGQYNFHDQGYFNGLSAAQQQNILSMLWQWYAKVNTSAAVASWPQGVQDPHLTSPSQLANADMFGIVIVAYQQAAFGGPNSNYNGVNGVLDPTLAGSILAGA